MRRRLSVARRTGFVTALTAIALIASGAAAGAAPHPRTSPTPHPSMPGTGVNLEGWLVALAVFACLTLALVIAWARLPRHD